MAKKYYKWVSWTTPTATAQTTAITGGDMVCTASINSDTAWKAFDKTYGKETTDGWRTLGSSAVPQWWQVKFPYKLKITGLVHRNAYAGDNRSITGRFYTGSDMKTAIGDAFTSPNSNTGTTTIANIPSSGIITDTIYFQKTAGNQYTGIGELEITAQKAQVSTSSDYDFYENFDVFKAVDDGTKKIKYWKWASWTQPKLTSASQDGFTTYESSHYGSWAFWNVFKESPSQWHSLTVPQWCAWGYINPLKITKLAFIGNGNGNIADFQVQASDDNATWTTLKTVNNTVVTGNFTVDLSSNTKGYRYYRLYITRGYYTAGGHDNIALISGITITATQLVEGTASDYSYYEETDVFKVAKSSKRKYYKYTDTANQTVDLYASNNTSYINSSTKRFTSTNDVTAWTVEQTYKLNTPITAINVTGNAVTASCQANCGWKIKITANGSTVLWEQDFGYGTAGTGKTKTYTFSKATQINSITIYAQCYRRSDQYAYGKIDLGLTYTKRVTSTGTASDYSVYEDVPVYHLFKE